MPSLIGEAFIAVRPEMAGFKSSVEAGARVPPVRVRLSASAAGAEEGIAKVRAAARLPARMPVLASTGPAIEEAAAARHAMARPVEVPIIPEGLAAAGARVRETFAETAKLAGGAFLGIGAFDFFKRSITDAAEYEQEMGRLKGTLRSVGETTHGAMDRTVEWLDVQQKQSAFSKVELANALIRATQGSGSLEKGMQRVAAAAELARARQIPLANATLLIGRVAAGGYATLRRWGIEFEAQSPHVDRLRKRISELRDEQTKLVNRAKDSTTAQKQQITSEIEHAKQLGLSKARVMALRDEQRKLTNESRLGTEQLKAHIHAEIEAAQRSLARAKALDKEANSGTALALVHKRMEQAAKEWEQTTDARLQRAANTFEELRIQVGTKLRPVLADALTFLAAKATEFGKKWPEIEPVVDRVLNAIVNGLKGVGSAFGNLEDAVEKAWSLLGGVGQGVVSGLLGTLLDLASTLAGPVAAGFAVFKVITGIQSAVLTLGASFQALQAKIFGAATAEEESAAATRALAMATREQAIAFAQAGDAILALAAELQRAAVASEILAVNSGEAAVAMRGMGLAAATAGAGIADLNGAVLLGGVSSLETSALGAGRAVSGLGAAAAEAGPAAEAAGGGLLAMSNPITAIAAGAAVAAGGLILLSEQSDALATSANGAADALVNLGNAEHASKDATLDSTLATHAATRAHQDLRAATKNVADVDRDLRKERVAGYKATHDVNAIEGILRTTRKGLSQEQVDKLETRLTAARTKLKGITAQLRQTETQHGQAVRAAGEAADNAARADEDAANAKARAAAAAAASKKAHDDLVNSVQKAIDASKDFQKAQTSELTTGKLGSMAAQDQAKFVDAHTRAVAAYAKAIDTAAATNDKLSGSQKRSLGVLSQWVRSTGNIPANAKQISAALDIIGNGAGTLDAKTKAALDKQARIWDDNIRQTQTRARIAADKTVTPFADGLGKLPGLVRHHGAATTAALTQSFGEMPRRAKTAAQGVASPWDIETRTIPNKLSKNLAPIVPSIQAAAAPAGAAGKSVASSTFKGLDAGLAKLRGAAHTHAAKVAPAIEGVKGAVEGAGEHVGLAVASGAGKGAEQTGPKTMVPVTGGVVSAINAGVSAAVGATLIGEQISSGVAAGINLSAAATALAAAVHGVIAAGQKAANAHSPSREAIEKIGYPIGEGIQVGIQLATPSIVAQIKLTVGQAVETAQRSLGDIGSTVSGSIGQVLDAQLANSTAGKALAAAQAQVNALDFAQQQAQLKADEADQTKTPAERAKARADLQLLLAQHAYDAQAAQVDQEKTLDERRIADLTDAFNRGLISQKGYQARIERLLHSQHIGYHAVGKVLGLAFADGFFQSIEALFTQARLLGRLPGGLRGFGTPTGVSLSDPLAALSQSLFDARQKLKDMETSAKDTSGPGGKTVTPQEQRAIKRQEDLIRNLERILRDARRIDIRELNVLASSGDAKQLLRELNRLAAKV